jgi:para-nitrobenzyl esterase
MSSYWAEFAYTGSPGRGRSGTEIEWQAWDNHIPVGDKFIVFDTQEDGGIRMSNNIITQQALKYRLLADTSFSSQKEHCGMYVRLFAGTDLWDDEEYEHLGKCGCKDYPPEVFQ